MMLGLKNLIESGLALGAKVVPTASMLSEHTLT